ncbi:MAG: methyltransferase domain-containing protein [Syntrophaceae bacterium]|nr:methyltransferase domain-containing protein [Syntrophaceae bacterium]NTW76260.1 methyltransferase domain-containing protein [Syntrophaceae bacterium]
MEVNPINHRHFQTLKPLCPVCRPSSGEYLLEIGKVIKGNDDYLQEGILVCSNEHCRSEFPVINGIPIILANLRSYISQNILPLLSRDDLSSTMESLLGDCAGPGSAFDSSRQYLSTYCFAHYGDLDAEVLFRKQKGAGTVMDLFKRSMALLKEELGGCIVDIGCSVGRTTFELASSSDDLVLGVDLNFGMLKVAREIIEKGRVTYPLRREGIVYERRSFPVSFENLSRVDFWVCDAVSLPFSKEVFSGAASFNVLDCLWSPHEHLREISRILLPQAKAIVSTPFDWSANVTPVEAWLGGHSQRAPHEGFGVSFLRALLSSEKSPVELRQLEILQEENVPWNLRLHDRSLMQYSSHLMILRKSLPESS